VRKRFRRLLTLHPGFAHAAVALALALSACQRRATVTAQSLVVLVPAAPIGVLPNTVNEDFTLSVLSNVYEALVDLDPKLQLRPGLAESWYTTDETTWVFRLRKGVTLQDGRPLKATDVVASLEHARNNPASRRCVQLSAVRDVSARDDTTVVIRTAQAFNALPLRLANVYIWASSPGGAPVGTGPYRLVAAGPDESVLAAFEGYRQGPPPIARIVFRVVPDVSDRVRLLESGTAHFMIDVPSREMERLNERMNTRRVGGLRVFLLGLSCKPGSDNPFRDVRARKAVALAIDRQALIARLGGNAQVVDEIASPEELGGHHVTFAAHPYDPAQARRLLKEAGHPGGFEVDLDYSVKHRFMERMLQELERQLAQVGITVRPIAHPAPDYNTLIEHESSRMYLLSWVSDTGDGRVSYDYLLHSRSELFGVDNASGYSSKEMDDLIEAASRQTTPEGLDAVFERLARKVFEDVPLIPLLRQEDLYAFAPNLVYTPRLDRRLRFRDAHWR
jgi:peptide/nickel transport system substrate-binding protein